ATDASADQITHAFPHPQIRYAVATAEASGLPSQSVDLVTVGLALHWLNLERFYQEVARVVRPGGAIAVWCTNIFQLPEATPAVQQLITELYEELIYPFRPPEIQIVEDRYQTIPFPFAEIPAPTFSRTALWTADRLMGYVSTWSAAQQLIAAQGEGAIANFTDRLRAAWGDPSQPQPVHWQIYLRAGRIAP
ncbi:MAG TPA: class I SAM-dependent methyltransferase, partial [Chroococcidiopsis sp.]